MRARRVFRRPRSGRKGTFDALPTASRSSDYRSLLLLQLRHRGLTQVQVISDQLPGRECQPLVQRDVSKAVAVEQLEKPQRAVAGVLDVVRGCERDVPDVAGTEVEGARLRGRVEHGHARPTLDEV